MFAEAGKLDVCAAVAGIWPTADVPVWELSLERWRETLDANLTATFLTARGFLRGLGDREGSLVLVGSTAGHLRRGRPRRLRRRQVGDPRRPPALAEERGRPPQPPRARERRRARLDGLADDRARPRRRRPSPGSPARWRCPRPPPPRRSQPRSSRSASPLISGHVTGQVVTVAGGMEGRTIRD